MKDSKKTVEDNSSSFAFPSQSIYVEQVAEKTER